MESIDSIEMKNLNLLYALASIVFLIVLAISPTKDYFTEWRHYQNEYNSLLSSQPRRIKLIPIGIKQIWNSKLDRVDRCTSCHLGVKEIGLVAAQKPFKPHPPIYHDLNEFGCTTCHEGQGLATSTQEAHDGSPSWEKPLLPIQYLEASCGRCHQEKEVTDASVLTFGRQLLHTYNCAGCHKIGDVELEYAPRLDGIGAKTTWHWLVSWLRNPKAFRPETRMPDFKLSQGEAELLADFLMSFNTFPNSRKLQTIPPELTKEYPPDDWAESGKTLFRQARCISCHLVEGKGGPLAPDLAKVASKANTAWLYSYLLDPKGFQPDVKMPRFGFSEKEAQKVTAYMVSEFVDWDAPPDTIQHKLDPNFYEKGLKLFNKYNCGGCHELSGIAKTENIGPELTDLGDRHLYQLEFGKTTIPRTLPDYIYYKLKDARQFIQTARMPIFGFKEGELQAITTALLAMSKENLPEKYLVRAKPISQYDPQAKFGHIVNKYSCFSCHVINGRGFLLATDLTNEGSRAQLNWIKNYFKVPYSMRPILTERMPNLFMSDQEIAMVVDYFDTVLRSDKIDSLQIALDDFSLVDEGKGLFFEKYGCQSCHQVLGMGGYVGPPLDRTGERLTPGWVYLWIKDPQKYYPGTLEPNAGLNDHEARAITSFLMSLKAR